MVTIARTQAIYPLARRASTSGSEADLKGYLPTASEIASVRKELEAPNLTVLSDATSLSAQPLATSTASNFATDPDGANQPGAPNGLGPGD